MAATRPLVTVQGTGEQITLPEVFLSPIRPDIVQFVHTNMNKNARQAYSVNRDAGHQHSAESWGTGRAVSRIPRVSGSGSHRAGQGAFGNMCRKGRMFAPTRTWRRWHRKINVNQKRYATISALAASALPALVMARGHHVEQVDEVPLVVSPEAESIAKTKQAIDLLKEVGAYDDVVKAKNSKQLRSGRGKARNRRYVLRKGPLVVYSEDNGITKAFRNLPGVTLCKVDSLNLLELAPGGHLGRFIIWTKPAFERLNQIYGTFTETAELKKGYKLPTGILSNSDIARIINSDEIQSIVRPAQDNKMIKRIKRNPLRNRQVMLELNPYAEVVRDAEKKSRAARAEAIKAKRSQAAGMIPAMKAFYSKYIAKN